MPKYPTFIKQLGIKLPVLGGLLQDRKWLTEELVATQLELQKYKPTQISQKKPLVKLPVEVTDLQKVSSEENVASLSPQANKTNLAINWVIPPPLSHEGGGHNTIMSIIRYLESAGHVCRVYSYDPLKQTTLGKIKEIVQYAYPDVKAEQYYGTKNMKECDVIFATSWETAYPVYSFRSTVKKFYLVQDYEPYFFPTGSMSNLAQRTYGFNFFGITAGKWLSEKVGEEHGMRCNYFDFGSDTGLYNYTNSESRQKILFYFQPSKPRRGYEIGIAALELFNKKHPEYEILLLGTDEVNFQLPFPYKNLGAVHKTKLNKIYNQCAAALIMSFTNMSLLPLEVMSAGCIPVVNQGPNNSLVSDNKYIKYSDFLPSELSKSLCETVERKDIIKYSKIASESVKETNWESSFQKINEIILKEYRNA